MARVRTSESARRAGRPGRRGVEGWLARHQSSTDTYNETRKESRSMRHHLWEKVRYQHKISAPSLWSAITHQTSKNFPTALTTMLTHLLRRFGRRPLANPVHYVQDHRVADCQARQSGRQQG